MTDDTLILLDADENPFLDASMAQSPNDPEDFFALVRIGDLAGERAEKTFAVDEEAVLVRTNMDIEITDPARGVILHSPNGHRWRMTVDNTGRWIPMDLDA